MVLAQIASAYALAGNKNKATALLTSIEAQVRQRFAGSMCLAFTQASEKRNKPSPGLRRLIEIVLIECPSSGWIPDSTRCAGIRVSTTCYVASVFRCKLRFGWTGTPQNVRGGSGKPACASCIVSINVVNSRCAEVARATVARCCFSGQIF